MSRNLARAAAALAAAVLIGLGLTGCPELNGEEDDNGDGLTRHLVTFNTNGGSTVPSQRVADGGFATVPSPAPTRSGHALTGWFNQEAGGTEFNFAATAITAPVTVYARWVTAHAVTFATHGGTPVPAVQQVASGGFATVPSPAPTRAGHNFTGWFTMQADGAAFDFTAPVTGPVTVHAQWQELRPGYHMVTFNTHGGTPVPSQQIPNGGFVTEPAQPPARDNHNFTGWFNQAEGGTAFAFTTTMVTAPVTVHAQWITVHTVTFATHGGSEVPSQPVEHGGRATVPAQAPTRAGHNFAGWFTPRPAARSLTLPTRQ